MKTRSLATASCGVQRHVVSDPHRQNRNHHKRHDCVWQKDRHRHRRVNIAQYLALTRNALLAIIPFDDKRNLPFLISEYQRRQNPRHQSHLPRQAHPMTSQAKRPGQSFPKFGGPAGGRAHGIDESGAQTMALELGEAGDGGAAG